MTCKFLSVFSKVASTLLVALIAHSCFAAMQTVSEGTYVDANGDKTLWHINDAHALTWGGRPYLPAGGLFQSRYLTDNPTDAEWDADTADLATLKSHGITDIILASSCKDAGITHVPQAALQKMLDYLQANGFTYGLDIDDFPRDPILAYTINPAIYRAPSPQANTDSTFRNIPDIQSARFFLVATEDGSVLASGDANVREPSTAVAALGQGMGGDGSVLLLYPERKLDSESPEGAHLPDIWSDADNYRDHLLLYFSGIHFGKNLRFFLDPIVDKVGFFGDAGEGMVPDSDGYRLGFQTWLLSHYAHNLGLLNQQWGIKGDMLADFSIAARCVPLWYEDKGIGILLDPSNDKQYQVDPVRSKVWDDIRQYREASLLSAMNGLADSLKSGVVDVPVIYRWSEPSSIFINPQHNSGYDGLLVSTDDHGENIGYNTAGFAYSEAEQAGRTQWLVGELTPRGVATADSHSAPTSNQDATKGGDSGYTSQAVFTEDQSALQDIGVKGFYINALRRLPDSRYAAINLLDAKTEQLDWLHAAGADLDVASSGLALQKPSILYYPTNISLPGIGIRELGSGVWWLPTNDPGKALDLGPGLEGYSMNDSGGVQKFVVWSPDGSVTQPVFDLPKGNHPYVTTAGGVVVTVVDKKSSYMIPVQTNPEEIEGLAGLPLPQGAVDAAFKEAERLITAGVDSKTPMDVFSQRLDYIRNSVLIENNPSSQQLAYDMLHDTIGQLSSYLSPFDWVEGEDSTSQNFGTIVSSPEASGHAYLWLDTSDPPTSASAGVYHADYAFGITSPGDYSIWAALAPGPPGEGAASPMTVSIDNATALNVMEPLTDGRPYGTLANAETATKDGQFVWCQLADQQLTPGRHTISIAITGTAPSSGRYTMGIDCICVTRGHFHADGINKPGVQ